MSETIGALLIRRLGEEGIGHVFGVPGDYVLTFFKEMEKSQLAVVNTSDEQGAGFAADAYARVRGLGAVCVTYCVGGLKIANAVGQAYAERSPVVVISGAPGTRERKNTLLHHTVRAFDTQARVFAELTAATAILDDPDSAADEINRVLSVCRRTSRPVYIEIPRDMVLAEAGPARRRALSAPAADPDALGEAVAEAMRHIGAAKRPVIIAGEELHRFRLQKPLADLVAKSGIPVAATIMGKSVFPESDPAYIGVYEGAMGRDATRAAVEASDCLILLGAMMTDMNLGIYTAKIDRRFSVYAASDKVSVGLATYDGVGLGDFVTALAAEPWQKRAAAGYDHPEHPGPFAASDAPMTTAALFHQVNAFLTDNDVVVADTGD